MSTSTTLPDSFRDVEHLEEVMTTPTAALIADLPHRGDLEGIAAAGRDHLTLAFSADAHDEAVDALLDAMGC